jgi:ketosteroid isomerase-like protein
MRDVSKGGDSMSTENIAIMDRFVAAVLAGELNKLPELIDNDFELVHSSTVPYAGIYKGSAGFMRFLDIFMNSYDIERLEPVETFASPTGAVVVELAFLGKFKSSGKPIDTTILEKWEFRGGKVVRIKPHYFDPNPID